MKYLIDPFDDERAMPFDTPDDTRAGQAPPPGPDSAESWPLYFPLYGVNLPRNDTV